MHLFSPRLLSIAVCSLVATQIAAPVAAQSVMWQTSDAEVWSRQMTIEGTMTGASSGVLHHDGTLSAFDADEGAFGLPVMMNEGTNTFVACTADESVCSDTLRWTLGFELRPELFAYAEVSGRSVTLTGDVIDNPLDADLAFAWNEDPDNPAAVTLAGAGGPETTFDLPEDAPDGEYYFDLTATTQGGKEARARTFVTAESGEIRPFDIETDHAAWVDRAVIYEIAPFYWGRFWPDERLDMITEKIPELADLGITTIWLQPITETHAGGQAYDVIDYFAIRDGLGSEEQLRELVDTAHEHNLKVLFDFVANHSSIHHPYAEDAAVRGEHSHYHDFYQRQFDGAPYSNNYTYIDDGQMRFVSYFWDDLVIFDYENPEVDRFIIEASRYWIDEFDIDGYRFDAVWGPHARDPEFMVEWRHALKRLKPEVLLLAEAKAPTPPSFPAGFPSIFESFDVAYDWKATSSCISYWSWAEECLYSAYENGPHSSIFNTGADFGRARDLRRALTNDGDGYPDGAKILRYLENNDVPRFRANHSLDVTRMAAALLFTVPGIPMLYYGQESGMTEQWPVIHPGRSLESYDGEGLYPWFRYLIGLRDAYPSLRSENFAEVDVSAPASGHTFAFHRWIEDEHLIGVVNMGSDAVVTDLSLPAEEFGAEPETAWYLTDLMTGDHVETTGEELSSVEVEVHAHSAALYVVADSVVSVMLPTPVASHPEMPASVELESNYPDPVATSTVIPFRISSPGRVRLQVFDMLGRRVASPLDETRSTGAHEVEIDARPLSPGVYVIRLQVGERIATQTMTVLR